MFPSKLSEAFQTLVILLLIVGVSLLLLFSIFARPWPVVQQAGAADMAVTGLYPAEIAPDFSYAYTAGDAILRIPQIGVGWFVLSARLGGPNGDVPLMAHVNMASRRVVLGGVDRVRVYRVLMSTSRDSNVDIRIRSTTAVQRADPRRLGVLLAWLRLDPITLTTPPLSALVSVPIALLLLWIAMTQLDIVVRWKIILLLLGSMILLSSYALCRGKLELQPLWFLGPSFFVVAVLTLSLVEHYCSSTPLRGVAVIFGMWQILLWLIAGVGISYSKEIYQLGKAVASGGSFTDRAHFAWELFVGAWLHWDSGHYYAIARNGYTFTGQSPNIAFFPLYPLLMRVVAPLVGHDLELSAVLVAHVALFAALWMLFAIVARDFGYDVACRTLVFLLVFPTSFFLAAGYSESLALALAVTALWAMRRERWWIAGISGFFLALTRIPGVMITPVLALTYLQHHSWHWRTLLRSTFLAVLLPPAGLSCFMFYQWWHTGTPIAFLLAQQGWENHAQPPWQTAYSFFTTTSAMRMFQAGVWFSFIALIALALLHLPLAYSLTMLALLIPAYTSSSIESFPRYILIGFPAFIVMAIFTKRRWVRVAMISTLLFLFIGGTLLYVNGFWIA